MHCPQHMGCCCSATLHVGLFVFFSPDSLSDSHCPVVIAHFLPARVFSPRCTWCLQLLHALFLAILQGHAPVIAPDRH